MEKVITQEQIKRLIDLVDNLAKLRRESAQEKSIDVLIRLREQASELMQEVRCG